MNTFKFSLSVVRPNRAKFKTASISIMKGVSLALCCIDCTDFIKKQQKF